MYIFFPDVFVFVKGYGLFLSLHMTTPLLKVLSRHSIHKLLNQQQKAQNIWTNRVYNDVRDSVRGEEPVTDKSKKTKEVLRKVKNKTEGLWRKHKHYIS